VSFISTTTHCISLLHKPSLYLYLSFNTMPHTSMKPNNKRVHFAKVNTFHSPAPATPATPALSFGSSIPSSSGPITPPDTYHRLPGPTPYMISYVPAKNPQYVGPFRPHRLLESAAVNWNMMENPSTITLNHRHLSSRLLVEMATSRPLPAFSITCIHLPWVMTIRASNGVYVTLEDFFESIYRAMRTNVSNTEFNLLPHQKDRNRATLAYENRCRRFRNLSAHDMEKRGGMKRVDFLMGLNRFHSISNAGHRSDEWRLNVS
jgi:hypothetical protein